MQYWQVSSVVLKALGTASTAANKDGSRLVSVDTAFSGVLYCRGEWWTVRVCLLIVL